MSEQVDVLVVGSEPAALSCCWQLLEDGARVGHVFPEPFGILGSTRDIGLAYPELGEPWLRISDSLGSELAREFHSWGKRGIELLQEMAPDTTRRGSRLAVARRESESKQLADDAIARQEIGDESRLMSGAAASNYAPLSELELASLETHALAFAPVATTAEILLKLKSNENYIHRGLDVDREWQSCRVETGVNPSVRWSTEAVDALAGSVAIVASGIDTTRILGKFHKVLVPIVGQAFRSSSLREISRTNVVGLSASWGYERYRFDGENRLVACGIDPTQELSDGVAEVDDLAQEKFQARAGQLFTDLHRSEDFLRWATIFANTCDGLPLLGPLAGDPMVQVIEGFSTSAWSRGVTAGVEIAKLLRQRQRQSTVPLVTRCSPRRFA